MWTWFVGLAVKEKDGLHKSRDRLIEQLGRPTDNIPHTVGGDTPPAYEEGARAKRTGKGLQDNPYDHDSADAIRWAAGWYRPGMYLGDA